MRGTSSRSCHGFFQNHQFYAHNATVLNNPSVHSFCSHLSGGLGSRIKLCDDVLCAHHSALIRDLLFEGILGLFESSFTNRSALYNRFYIFTVKLFRSLRLQVYEIIRHLS